MSIYVLRSDNLVKIGFSCDLRKRVGQIIGMTPVPVEFVGHMPGDRDLEAHLHSRFEKWRFSGEWFVETAEMRSVFDVVLTPKLPELEAIRSKKRTADANVLQEMSDAMRAAAESEWPLLRVGKRLDQVSLALGWNRWRVHDVYYQHPNIALRAFELDEVRAWAALVKSRHMSAASAA